MKKLFLVIAFFCAVNAQAQSPLATLANSMQPGTWSPLATSGMTPTFRNTGGASDLINGYGDSMRWDAASRQMFYLGSDHAGNPTPGTNGSYRFVRYSDATNTWDVLPPPPWVNYNYPNYNDAHGYDKIALDSTHRTIYRNPYNSSDIHTYNIDSGSWGMLPAIPSPYPNCCDALDYFPELGGLFYQAGNGNQSLFNITTQQWTVLGTDFAMLGTWRFAEYNPIHHLIVFGDAASGKLKKVSSVGAVTGLQNIPVSIYDGTGWTGNFTVDPVSGDYLALTAGANRKLYTYNVLTDVWTLSSNTPPGAFAGLGAVISAPISTYGVVMFAFCPVTPGAACQTYLYKHSGSAGPPANNPPTVNAGPDISVVLPSAASLAGQAADDGLPSNMLIKQWSGPVGVVFSAPTSANTTATFPSAGSYTLTLTVNDGVLSANDSLNVTVGSAPTPKLIIPFDTTSQGSDGKSYRVQGTATEQ